jgi:cell division septation protein DedD
MFRVRSLRKPSSSATAPSLMLAGALLLLTIAPIPTQVRDSLVGHRLLQSSATASVDPSSAEVDVGDTTTVDIYVEDVVDLNTVDILVTFDPALLEVVDADTSTTGVQIEIGPFLGADVSVTTNSVDQSAGDIYFVQEVFSDTVSGDGVVATITFQGKAAGTSDITIEELYLEDGAGEAIEASAQDGSITVAGEVTPSPTAGVTPSPTAEVTPTPTRTPTPGPTSTPAPTATPAPTSVPTVQPTATPSIEARVLQLWPDRSIGVISELLVGAAAHADTQVFPFGAISPSAGEPVEARTYLHFPLAVFPLGTQVKRATLYVYVDSASGPGEAAFGAYRVLEPWGETGWNGDPASWPTLLDSPIAITETSFDAEEAALPASPSARLARVMSQSPLPTPTPSSSVLPTPTQPTSTPKPTATHTPSPAVTSTPKSPTPTPGSSPTSTPTLELEPMEGRWLTWDVTALLRAWLAEEVPDRGLALAAVSDADSESAGSLILARLLAADDPDTMPYIIADIEIHPVTPTPTPTPVPILPIAGSSGEWEGAVVLLAGAVLLALGLALAAWRGRSTDQ